MLHDPHAFAHVARRMRRPPPPVDLGPLPSVAELIRRMEAARCMGRPPAP